MREGLPLGLALVEVAMAHRPLKGTLGWYYLEFDGPLGQLMGGPHV
jgi:hypothetical protein